MSALNVLITSPIEEEYLHQIAAVDPEIKIFEGSELAGHFATEPLPVKNRLWELPNVIYSPHISGGGENVESLVHEGFRENLKLYLEGKRLLNIVDKKRGY